VSFFKQMAAAGLPSSKLPVMSFSIAEQEAKAIGPSLLVGSYAAWNYFQSLPDPVNKKFVAAYQAKYPGSPVDDPMAHGYLDVYEWAAAVTKAGSFDPEKVRKAAVTLAYSDVGLGETKFAANQSLVQTGYVGQLMPDGQFKILWQSKGPIAPVPYDPLSFPGKSCVL
jgi:urea transport system substrate-binding protein